MMDKNRYTLDSGEELSCLEMVRSLPGKRKVFLGEHSGKKVFVKLFLDSERGERHWNRELHGLEAFRQCQIQTVNLLYSGKTAEQGLPVIILDHLSGAVSVMAAWASADTNARKQLLKQMTTLLAQHHNAGLLQTDLHLDNFMLCADEIISLDGAGVKIPSGGVSRSSALENLGLFMAQLPPEWELYVSDVCAIYWSERAWSDGQDSDQLLRQVKKSRKMRWRKFRHKLYRNTTAFCYEKQKDGFQVAVREYLSKEMYELLKNPDASYPGCDKALKNGNTCTVWATQVDGRGLVIKRYNVKSFWHGIRLLLFPGRGESSWFNGNCLRFYDIPTPRPVALIKRRNGLYPIAYKITEQVSSENAWIWFRDQAHSSDEVEAMAHKIVMLLQKLQQQKISHGDLKASNILINNGEPMLIDLDAMYQHANNVAFSRAWLRDIRRFLKNWDSEADLQRLFINVIKSRGITLPDQTGG